MSVFLHVTLEVKAAGMEAFCAAMAEVTPIVEAAGWKLAGAYIYRTGKFNTVIDLWEMADMNSFDTGLLALAGHPRYPALKKVLDETVNSETVNFAGKAPYAH